MRNNFKYLMVVIEISGIILTQKVIVVKIICIMIKLKILNMINITIWNSHLKIKGIKKENKL